MKKAAVIQDISGLGKCSLAAALPVLSCMGVQVCPVPTAVLTAQTGFEAYRMRDCSGMLRACIRDWTERGVRLDAIYTGFLADAAQGKRVWQFVRALRTPATLLLVDPVLGDHGTLYPTVTPELQKQMRRLVDAADVITPNLTEACLLTGTPYETVTAETDPRVRMRRIRRIGRLLTPSTRRVTVITGITACRGGAEAVGNLISTPQGQQMVWSRASGGSYSGTGDLFASALLGGLLRGDPVRRSVQRASRMIERAARLSFEAGTDPREGVAFEACLRDL